MLRPLTRPYRSFLLFLCGLLVTPIGDVSVVVSGGAVERDALYQRGEGMRFVLASGERDVHNVARLQCDVANQLLLDNILPKSKGDNRYTKGGWSAKS